MAPERRELRALVFLGLFQLAIAAVAAELSARRAFDLLAGALAVIALACLALALRTASGISVLCRGLPRRPPGPSVVVTRHPYRSSAQR